jgi:CBS-domain-containing membrane protein
MNVAELMTRDVPTCRTDDSLNRAAQLMWERCCGSLPVVDESDHVVGVVTDRDVTMAAYTQGRPIQEIPVAVAMSTSVQSCAPSATIEQAEDLMMAYAVHRLPVIDDGQLRGLISLDDIARTAAAAAGRRRGGIDLERVALALGEIARRRTSADQPAPDGPPPERDAPRRRRATKPRSQTRSKQRRVASTGARRRK